jgi:hypothetical protein
MSKLYFMGKEIERKTDLLNREAAITYYKELGIFDETGTGGRHGITVDLINKSYDILIGNDETKNETLQLSALATAKQTADEANMPFDITTADGIKAYLADIGVEPNPEEDGLYAMAAAICGATGNKSGLITALIKTGLVTDRRRMTLEDHPELAELDACDGCDDEDCDACYPDDDDLSDIFGDDDEDEVADPEDTK